MWKRMFELRGQEDEGMGGGGSANAPSEAPLTEDTATSSTEDAVNWSGIAEDFVREDEGTPIVEGDAEVVVEEPSVTPPVESASEPVTAVTPPVQSEASTDPSPVNAPTPSAPPPAPAVTGEEYATWRSARIEQLQQSYALDEESANALLTEPEKVLPMLAARVHMEVLENSMRAMQAMVPVMVQQLRAQDEEETRARSFFTQVNPDLADPAYEATIMEFGSVFRRLNPSAPPEQAARAIGSLVRSALGLVAQPASASTGQTPPAAAPVTPFTPARGAGGGRPQMLPTNEFERMALEFLNDDLQ